MSAKQPVSEYDRIVALVAANPRAWLGISELATYFRLPEPLVTAACNGNDSPFIGKSCNTALFDAWLNAHAGIPSGSSVARSKPKKGEE